jgi:hypothetical protein
MATVLALALAAWATRVLGAKAEAAEGEYALFL